MSSYKPANLVLWLDIPVVDLDRAIAFYQSVFDVDARDARPHSSSATLKLSPQGSGITLILIPEAAQSISGLTPYLNCNKRLAQSLSKVILNGGSILQDVHSMEPFGYRAVISDSEGNRIALHSAEK